MQILNKRRHYNLQERICEMSESDYSVFAAFLEFQREAKIPVECGFLSTREHEREASPSALGCIPAVGIAVESCIWPGVTDRASGSGATAGRQV